MKNNYFISLFLLYVHQKVSRCQVPYRYRHPTSVSITACNFFHNNFFMIYFSINKTMKILEVIINQDPENEKQAHFIIFSALLVPSAYLVTLIISPL